MFLRNLIKQGKPVCPCLLFRRPLGLVVTIYVYFIDAAHFDFVCKPSFNLDNKNSEVFHQKAEVKFSSINLTVVVDNNVVIEAHA